MFKLSLDGKFVGLGRLVDLACFEAFAYKLFKRLDGRYRKLFGDVITMRVSGHTVKIYAW